MDCKSTVFYDANRKTVEIEVCVIGMGADEERVIGHDVDSVNTDGMGVKRNRLGTRSLKALERITPSVMVISPTNCPATSPAYSAAPT